LVQGEDGRYGRLDGRGLFAHRASLGALYDAQLRAELGARLCVTFVRARSGALEVAQVDPFLRGLYSGRSAELAQHRFERTRRSMRFIDREEKSFERDAVAWRRHWRNSAERMGVTVAALSQVSQRPLLNRGERENSQGATLDERHFAWRVGAHSATLCRRHVVGGAAHATLDGALIASLNAFVDAIATFGEGRGLSEGRVPLVAVTAKAHISELLGPRPLTVEALHRWQEVAASLTRSERDLSHGERDFGQRARSRALSTWQRESFR
jgi:hypothetical protein